MRVPRHGDIVNFGGTVRFAPRLRYRPASAAEVLEILDRHAADTIRVAGALHSWSEAARSDDVLLDLGYLDGVSVERDGPAPVAVIGGGCTIARALAQVHRLVPGFTLPGLGGGTAQTLAGAISTGTHGSGEPSLAHFVASLELAAFDPASGKARIHRIEQGEALRAARCALGCMGTILSLRMPLVPRASVRETVEHCPTLDAVLAQEEEFPLQHFLLLPYRWTYVVWRRKAIAAQRDFITWLHRTRLRLATLPLHFVVKAVASLNDARTTQGFYRHVFSALLPRGAGTADRRDLGTGPWRAPFRHVEIELLLPARHLKEATAALRHVLTVFADAGTGDSEVAAQLGRIGMADALASQRGRYAHHFPILFRRVLPDDALISATSGAREPYYAASLLGYRQPRDGFYALADFLARGLVRLYGAKCHWGTYNPLTYAEIAPLYPGLAAFRAYCAAVDPRGTFRNAYAARILGFVAGG